MPTPVSLNTTATRRRRADSHRIRSVPPFGIAWQALSARLRNAWRSIAGSPLTSGAPSQSTSSWTRVRSASGRTIGTSSPSSARSDSGCSFRSSGRVNLRNPWTTSSSRRISCAMTSTCWIASARSIGRSAIATAGTGPEPACPELVERADGRVFPGATCCRSSSRWIIIALSGFLTSCATPADSRPSAASLRE